MVRKYDIMGVTVTLVVKIYRCFGLLMLDIICNQGQNKHVYGEQCSDVTFRI